MEEESILSDIKVDILKLMPFEGLTIKILDIVEGIVMNYQGNFLL
jgi:hypothetical protein